MTIALWIATVLIVTVAIAGLAKEQCRLYRVNKRVRRLRSLRRDR